MIKWNFIIVVRWNIQNLNVHCIILLSFVHYNLMAFIDNLTWTRMAKLQSPPYTHFLLEMMIHIQHNIILSGYDWNSNGDADFIHMEAVDIQVRIKKNGNFSIHLLSFLHNSFSHISKPPILSHSMFALEHFHPMTRAKRRNERKTFQRRIISIQFIHILIRQGCLDMERSSETLASLDSDVLLLHVTNEARKKRKKSYFPALMLASFLCVCGWRIMREIRKIAENSFVHLNKFSLWYMKMFFQKQLRSSSIVKLEALLCFVDIFRMFQQWTKGLICILSEKPSELSKQRIIIKNDWTPA